MKKIEMHRTANRMTYRVDGKRASLKTATQAEEGNHREIVNLLLDAYEEAHDVESVSVKNDDFNPRANNGVFVVTIFAEFAWRFVPAPKQDTFPKTDTDTLKVKRGYKNLIEAVNAAKYVKKHLGRDFCRDGQRFTGALILKDFEFYWQVLYHKDKEITYIDDKCRSETAESLIA